jgi:hypothetical protein
MVFAAPCILREIGVIPISRWVIATNPTPNAYHCRGRARRGRGCEEPWAHDLQLISLGEVLSALAAELAGKPPDSHRSKPFKSASSGHDSRAILRYRMSTTKSKRAASPTGASAIRGPSRRAGPNRHVPGINLRMSNLIPRSHSV